ncbi:MAG: SRPBCC family protein [Henriciella sp.]
MAEYGVLKSDGLLEFERLLPGPIERVWDYFVKPELRAKWLCGGETGSAPGGLFRMSFDNARLSRSPAPDKYADQEVVSFDGEILVFDPPHHLEFSWPSEQGNPPTQVSVKLSSEGEKVRLVLRHWRLESDEFINGASAGWHAHLDLLEDNLMGRELKDFWPHHMALEAVYAERLK